MQVVADSAKAEAEAAAAAFLQSPNRGLKSIEIFTYKLPCHEMGNNCPMTKTVCRFQPTSLCEGVM